MRTLKSAAEQPLGVLMGFAIASILFLAAFTLALTSGRVLATHGGGGNVHACVSIYTGQARIIRPGQAPNCSAAEQLVEWPGTGAVGDLEGRIQALEDQVPDCLATEGVDAVFEGCNVHVRNGLGQTNSANGVGNLIIGYNENVLNHNRSGSHNAVVGQDHGYSSFGGLVAGSGNTISGSYASVTGGFLNVASGDYSSVSGGQLNTAEDRASSVSGGTLNDARGFGSSITGGFDNEASNDYSSVNGGANNLASGIRSTVSGGGGNEASGWGSTVSGGSLRTTDSMDPTWDWRGGSLIEDD